MHLGRQVCHRIAAVSAVAVGLAGAVAAGPASGAGSKPPCTKQALSAGLKRGTARVNGKIGKPFGCAGTWAYSSVQTSKFEFTALFRADGTRWATASRSKYCKVNIVPKKIFKPACLSN